MFFFNCKYDTTDYDDDYWQDNYKELLQYPIFKGKIYKGYRSKFSHILKQSIYDRKNIENKNKYKEKKNFKKEFLELLELDVNKQYYIITIYNIIWNSLNKNVYSAFIDNTNKLFDYYKTNINDRYYQIKQPKYYIVGRTLLDFIKKQVVIKYKSKKIDNNINVNINFNINDIGKKINKLII